MKTGFTHTAISRTTGGERSRGLEHKNPPIFEIQLKEYHKLKKSRTWPVKAWIVDIRNNKWIVKCVADDRIEHGTHRSTSELLNSIDKRIVKEVLINWRLCDKRIARLVHGHRSLSDINFTDRSSCGNKHRVFGVELAVAVAKPLFGQRFLCVADIGVINGILVL
jgi:hypothetical protein